MTITALSRKASGKGTAVQGEGYRRLRRISLLGGWLYLVTFFASIPARILIAGVLDNPDYITSTGSDTAVLWGNILDVVTAVSGVGTALALYPVVKRQNQSLALGFLATRLMEAAIIFIGVVSLLSVVTLRQDLAGASGTDAAALSIAGRSLVATHDWASLLGPELMAGLNALMLATLMYRSRLVPRVIPLVGLIGVPLIIASTGATIFGLFGQFSGPGAILAFPIALWEGSLGVYLIVKGFKPAPITAELLATDTAPASPVVAV